MRTFFFSSTTAIFFSTLAAATTWIVTPDGTGDFPTIQAAINAVANGDSVALTDGVYTGDGNRDVEFSGKGITVLSLSGEPRACIIDCEGSPEEYHRGFLFNSGEPPWSGLSGLTIMHAWEGWSSAGAIECTNSDPTIRNCIIRDNECIYGGGLSSAGQWRQVNVLDCTFQHNSGAAVRLIDASPVFTNCTFVDNAPYGIVVEDSWPTLEDCIIAGTETGPAIFKNDMWWQSEVELSCCNLFGNFGGDWVGFIEDQLGINGNFSADPLFCLDACPEAPYSLHENSPCMPGGHPPCGLIGAWGAGCPPAERACCIDDLCQIMPAADCELAGGTWFASIEGCVPSPCDGVYRVRADGTGDFPTIQAAIDASPTGHVIELEDGVFTGEGNINLDLWDRGITVRSASGNPELCIIDCEGHLAGPDEVRRAFYLWRALDPSTVVQGITLCNGHAGSSGEDGSGGAVLLGRNSAPTFDHCIFRDNEAYRGGAVLCDAAAAPHFCDCQFGNNSLLGSTGDGGAVWCGITRAHFLRCTFTDNLATRYGGAIRLYDGEDLFEECTFTGNSAQSGGAISYQERSKADAIGCLFVDNHAVLGGVAWADHYTEPSLINCTLYGNNSGTGGAVNSQNHAQFELQNTIIAFGSEGSAVSCATEGTATLTCCDVFGNAGGDWIDCIADQLGVAGNICEDPLFCDAGTGDFRLDGSSPCAPFTPPNQECDQIGAFDIGCGSSGTQPGETPIRALELRPPAPNPFSVGTSLAFLLPPSEGPGRITVDIIDASGRRLLRLLDGIGAPGTHRVRWDGTDREGQQVPCGLYFIRLSANGESRQRTVLRMQ